ncbi:MAG TPA: glycosyltransferase, partial [Chloroflexota bacterium]
MRPQKKAPARAGARNAPPAISACLIVKNEEAHLSRCLASIKDVVDEIILVDTGSTDRTVDIAREFGARVFHFEWCDDFSAARNESLRHATGDWIIWIDGDDELCEAAPGALRRLCTRRPLPEWGYWMDVRSPYGEGGDQEVTVRHWRLFESGRGICFRGRIHEEPRPPVPITQEQIAVQAEVRIDHWGYMPDLELLQQKSDRNRHLLELCVEEEPSNPLHHYNLGRQYNREGNYQQGLKTLTRALELWYEKGQPNWSFAHSLFAFAAQAALESSEFEKVLEIAAQPPDHLVSAELLCSAGVACWRLGRREEAIPLLERAWQDPSVVKNHLHDKAKSTWHPLLILTGLYDQTGQPEQAYACARRAHDFAPDHPEILLALGYLADKLGRRAESLTWLRQQLNGQRDEGFKPQARRLLLHIAEREKDPVLALEALEGEVQDISQADRVLRRAEAHAARGNVQAQYDELDAGCKLVPANATIRLALADFLAENRYDDEAIKVLGAGLDQPDAPPVLYSRLAQLLVTTGQLEDAA